jgi:hypothetical protein
VAGKPESRMAGPDRAKTLYNVLRSSDGNKLPGQPV